MCVTAYLSDKYGVCPELIWAIWRGACWGHVTQVEDTQLSDLHFDYYTDQQFVDEDMIQTDPVSPIEGKNFRFALVHVSACGA
jgi:hypothetical protein